MMEPPNIRCRKYPLSKSGPATAPTKDEGEFRGRVIEVKVFTAELQPELNGPAEQTDSNQTARPDK